MANICFSAVNLSSFRGGRCLFSQFHFSLQAGESLYIKGENGKGKTSLLRLLAGLYEPEQGTIYWCEQKITEMTQSFNKNMIFLGHQNNLNLSLTPLENIRLSWGLERGIELSDFQIKNAFEKVGFSLGNAPCYTLSAGQRRRVALARLALTKATLWLLDEPFTALDTAGINLIKNIMLSHLNQGGIIVYSSHLTENFNSYVYQL